MGQTAVEHFAIPTVNGKPPVRRESRFDRPTASSAGDNFGNWLGHQADCSGRAGVPDRRVSCVRMSNGPANKNHNNYFYEDEDLYEEYDRQEIEALKFGKGKSGTRSLYNSYMDRVDKTPSESDGSNDEID
ncbi:unnamed protein product [Protopolystoma xenopodis]|uniref:Uncharacterized protein n=1 Tax=Protopolystoma xenopodis TaxID=117903 RepID=A0A448X7Z4_9PLAT|nr:unnamed protein product [Protopolystoma xenopodis]